MILWGDKMKNVAIIAEYDPFHNGHKYQTDKLRELGANSVISIMGGCFSQRGTAYIADKYIRAEAAISSHGPDAILELPYPYCCSGAEYFAQGGTHIAATVCDSIAFGCETDDPQILIEIAQYLTEKKTVDLIRSLKKNGAPEYSSTPRVIAKVVSERFGNDHADAIMLPNNILAVEYLKAIYRFGYKLEPIFIRRTGAAHDSAVSNGNIASASLIRSKIANNDLSWESLCPAQTVNVIKRCIENGTAPTNLQIADRTILYRLLNLKDEILQTAAEAAGGLGKRIQAAAYSAHDLNELYSAISTKSFTNARLRRAVISCLTGVKEEDLKSPPSFTVLLGANAVGLDALKHLKEIKLISTPSEIEKLTENRDYALYSYAERLYSQCFPRLRTVREHYASKPFIIK